MTLKKVITRDQTETFLNEEVGESYHSYTGAVEEALKKYVIPCAIAERARSGTLVILDVCFGMGYNSAMAIEVALRENPRCIIEVIGLENDPEIVKKIQEVDPPIPFFTHYKRLTPHSCEFREGTVHVKILLGDARERVKEVPSDSVDAIFFDPFSPKTQPEMWQEAFFCEMQRVMKADGILATYSCARLGRENMAKAGLFYDDGPMVGRRGPGTLARKWV